MTPDTNHTEFQESSSWVHLGGVREPEAVENLYMDSPGFEPQSDIPARFAARAVTDTAFKSRLEQTRFHAALATRFARRVAPRK